MNSRTRWDVREVALLGAVLGLYDATSAGLNATPLGRCSRRRPRGYPCVRCAFAWAIPTWGRIFENVTLMNVPMIIPLGTPERRAECTRVQCRGRRLGRDRPCGIPYGSRTARLQLARPRWHRHDCAAGTRLANRKNTARQTGGRQSPLTSTCAIFSPQLITARLVSSVVINCAK